MSSFLPFVFIGLTVGSVYGLAGTGLVLTYRTSGIFNFAHGTLAALLAYAFYDLREVQGLPWPIAMAISLLVIAPVASLGLELIARRLAEAPVAMKVVATVGLLIAIQQAIIIRYGIVAIRVEPFLPTDTYRFLGVNVGQDQLIVMAVALAGMGLLTWLLAATSFGRQVRAVVDQPELLALMGTSPRAVRRKAWMLGTAFAGLSGILLAPTVGLDAGVLTLLVVQAFGAAAIGAFTSIPLTYVGGLVVGVLATLATKYVATIPWLDGFPASLPFIILFLVLVLAPRRWLVDFTVDRKPRVSERPALPRAVKVIGGLALVGIALRLPDLVGTRLSVWNAGMAYAIILLSLALLMGMSNQVSLAQMAFAAVGAAASAKLAVEAGLPWVLSVVLGALVAVPVGGLLAIPAIRRSGLFLALATFGFAVLLERLLFGTSVMFGTTGSLPAPRPSFAEGDRAYFYVMLVFLAAAIGVISLLHRSRLGRLVRAMADSPTALDTYGTSVTVVKVIVFCVSAFLAGLGGALLGPVTGSASPPNFGSFASLMLVVVFVLLPGSGVTAAIGASIAWIVLPSYGSGGDVDLYQPLVFGCLAVVIAIIRGRATALRLPSVLIPAGVIARRLPHRNPITARATDLPEPRTA